MSIMQLPKKIKQTARIAWHDWQEEQDKKKNAHLRDALSDDERAILESIETEGFAIIPNFWSREEALGWKDKLTGYLSNQQDTDFECGAYSRFGNRKHEYGAGVQRVYHVDRLEEGLRDYRFDSRPEKIIAAYYGKPFHSALLLFQHNLAKTVCGGYHIDGYKKEFKSFIYLDDVTLENGPFAYIRGSHRQHLRRMKRQLVGMRNGSSTNFVEDEVSDLYPEEVKLTAPAGTMLLVDVRGFHRGLDQLSNSRSVLVNYYLSEPGDVELGR